MKKLWARLLNQWSKISSEVAWDISYGTGFVASELPSFYENTLSRLERNSESVLSLALDLKQKFEHLQEQAQFLKETGKATSELDELLGLKYDEPFDEVGMFFPYTTILNGNVYTLYRVTFGTSNTFFIYAASIKHAEQRVLSIRDSAKLDGVVEALNTPLV